MELESASLPQDMFVDIKKLDFMVHHFRAA